MTIIWPDTGGSSRASSTWPISTCLTLRSWALTRNADVVAHFKGQEPSSNVQLSVVVIRNEYLSLSRTCSHTASRTLVVNREFGKGFIDKIVEKFRKAVSSLENFEKHGQLSIAELIGCLLVDCS